LIWNPRVISYLLFLPISYLLLYLFVFFDNSPVIWYGTPELFLICYFFLSLICYYIYLYFLIILLLFDMEPPSYFLFVISSCLLFVIILNFLVFVQIVLAKHFLLPFLTFWFLLPKTQLLYEASKLHFVNQLIQDSGLARVRIHLNKLL